MELITTLWQFIQNATTAQFEAFWAKFPLHSADFWQALWASLWPRDGHMEFTTFTFWAFLAICAFFSYLLPRVTRPLWLLVCSYGFYLYSRTGVQLVAVLIGATVITYLAGIAVGRLQNLWARRAFLWLAVLSSVGILGFYKYANFLRRTAADIAGLFGADSSVSMLDIPAVLGLSYFTFQSLGYVIDVYKGKIAPEKNPLYYALYVSFFPCIVTGPIERAGHLLPQLRSPVPFNYNRVAGGLFRMLWGVFKKLVIAGNLSLLTKEIFTHMQRYNGLVLALGALAFSYQLYMDFSGYCDIAIGAGRVLGFELLENFKRPFASRSYGELWARWHISLSSWFRDYVYIPLGGSRCSTPRHMANLMVTFLVSGLWHGDSMGYVVWGALNGVFVCVGKLTGKKRQALAAHNPLYKLRFVKALIQCSCVYLLFSVCMVFFAASFYGGGLADGFYLFGHLGASGAGLAQLVFGKLGLSTGLVWAVALSALFVELGEKWGRPDLVIRKIWFIGRWPLYYLMIAVILVFGNLGASGSVYGTF